MFYYTIESLYKTTECLILCNLLYNARCYDIDRLV
jgi:hypothetical protein